MTANRYIYTSIYTSINLLLDIIYNDKFFRKTIKTVKILCEVVTKQVLVPPKKILQTFFLEILTKYSTFEALNGFFRQIESVFMGGKLSLAIANILCHMFGKQIIKDEINNGKILAYHRYVDDKFVFI
jgi:hypothetical protein